MSKLFGLAAAAAIFLFLWIVVTVVVMFSFGAVCQNCPPATDFPYMLGGLGFVGAAALLGLSKAFRLLVRKPVEKNGASEREPVGRKGSRSEKKLKPKKPYSKDKHK